MDYKIGLYCGRFQPIHLGHVSIIKEAMSKVDILIIAIGSSLEEFTERNPLSFKQRKFLIEEYLRNIPGKFIIVGVPDRDNIKDDSSWGEYLLNTVESETGLRPTINFTGKEIIRSHWFDTVDIENIEIDRDLVPVSATNVRQLILENRKDDIKGLVPDIILRKFSELNNILKEIERINKEKKI